MGERFFLETPPRDGRALLSGDEARHLTRVLRAAIRDEVVLFSGSGTQWPARILRIGRDEVELETGAGHVDPPRAGPALTLAVALPKGERQKWLVEKLTELGVARLVPLRTERGVAEATPAAVERLGRGVIEACKQCGRNTLMEIGVPATVAEVLAGLGAGRRGLLADPTGQPLEPVAIGAGADEILALVGPEGGFTAAEVAAAQRAGAVRVSLGRHILRVETAALALAARLA